MKMDEHYYGVGRIRTLEARLLTPGQIERMADAYDFEAAFGVLSETVYAEILPRLKSPFDFEELCQLELVSLKNLMDRIAPENAMIQALLRKYDYLNLKILLRIFFKGSEAAATFSEASTIPLEKLKLYVFEGLRDMDEKEIIEAIDAAKSSYEQDKDPANLDILLDKHYFSYLKRTADLSPSLLIPEMVNHKIDLINLKTVLRGQGRALLDPGYIDKDILLDLRGKSGADIIARLSFTEYFPDIAAGLEHFDRHGSFYLLEKSMDDFILERFRKAKYLTSGEEPLVGFILAKETELKTLRFIMISKKNRIRAERIRERLRTGYA